MKRTIIRTTLDSFLWPLACVIARDLMTEQINGSDKSGYSVSLVCDMKREAYNTTIYFINNGLGCHNVQ